MYYDIHSHSKRHPDQVTTSIYSLNAADFICCFGLDLRYSNYSLGIHPWKIKEEYLSKNIDFIEKNASFDCVKAIGECGLDKRCDTPWDLQMKAFSALITISERVRKPLLIHCVKAFDELFTLKKMFHPVQAWIIHGFRGKPIQMQQAIKHGVFLSFGPYHNEETLQQTPSERIFLETDDTDYSIENVYRKVSGTLHLSESQLEQIIRNNFKRIFVSC